MEWFFIEALTALVIAIGIVWWTMAPARKLPPEVDTRSGDAKRGVAPKVEP